MKTSDEWRAWYSSMDGRTIEPASLLDDILRDMEELEAVNRFLTAALIRHKDVEVDV